MNTTTPADVNPATLTPERVEAALAEVLAELPLGSEGAQVHEALKPIEMALAARMHQALTVLTEAAQLERVYSKALETSPFARVHRFERYGPARSASFVQQWSLGHQWRRDKVAAGLLDPAAEQEA